MAEKVYEKIYSYQMVTEFTTKNSGFGKWGFAVRGGEEFFIKQFLAPVYPEPGLPISDDERQKRAAYCQAFYDKKMKLYNAVKKADRGNIIIIKDFFRYKTHFYIVTDKENTASLNVREIAALPMDKKLLLLKILAYNIQCVSEQGVVHGDLKPDNILIKRTAAGSYTTKLIDFDCSYFANEKIEDPENIPGDQIYFAPEAVKVMFGERDTLDTKVDVFALGILFHQYLTGELPVFSNEYDYLYEAVLDGNRYVISPTLAPQMQMLISKMLEQEPENRISIQEVIRVLNGGTANTSKEITSETTEKIENETMPAEDKRDSCSEGIDTLKPTTDENHHDIWDTPVMSGNSDMIKTAQNSEISYENEPGVTVSSNKKAVMIDGLKMSSNIAK